MIKYVLHFLATAISELYWRQRMVLNPMTAQFRHMGLNGSIPWYKFSEAGFRNGNIPALVLKNMLKDALTYVRQCTRL